MTAEPSARERVVSYWDAVLRVWCEMAQAGDVAVYDMRELARWQRQLLEEQLLRIDWPVRLPLLELHRLRQVVLKPQLQTACAAAQSSVSAERRAGLLATWPVVVELVFPSQRREFALPGLDALLLLRLLQTDGPEPFYVPLASRGHLRDLTALPSPPAQPPLALSASLPSSPRPSSVAPASVRRGPQPASSRRSTMRAGAPVQRPQTRSKHGPLLAGL